MATQRRSVANGWMRCGDPNNPQGPGINRAGNPCHNWCPPGFTRCHMHGGSVETSKLKAAQALALLRMPAIDGLYKVMATLEEMMDRATEPMCAACGYPQMGLDAQEVLIKTAMGMAKACQVVLDRVGFGPSATLEVRSAGDDLVDIALLTDGERNEYMSLFAQWEALNTRVRQRVYQMSTIAQPTDDDVALPPSTQP